MKNQDLTIERMKIDDYDEIHQIWTNSNAEIPGQPQKAV